MGGGGEGERLKAAPLADSFSVQLGETLVPTAQVRDLQGGWTAGFSKEGSSRPSPGESGAGFFSCAKAWGSWEMGGKMETP